MVVALGGLELAPQSCREVVQVAHLEERGSFQIVRGSVCDAALLASLGRFEAILHFAEFGVVLMLGGNIPGQTRTISVAIYDYVNTLHWREAHIIAAGMVIFSFTVILAMYLLEKRMSRLRE